MHSYINGSIFVAQWPGVLRTFTRFFPYIVLAGVDFGYDNYGLWPWQAKPRPKILSDRLN